MTSPFLPNTNIQYAWDSTSLGYLKTCPRLYQYIMIEGWQPRDESIHLRFGIEYHQALQEYDLERAAGIPHDDAVHDVVRALLHRTFEWHSDNTSKNRDTLVRSVVWYLEHFKDDAAQTYILSDGKPAVELSFRFELDFGPDQPSKVGVMDVKEVGFAKGSVVAKYQMPIVTPAYQPYLLCGHLDRVVIFQDELFVMDRKTTGSTPGSYYFDQFHPHNQMTLYALGSKIVLDTPVRGVIIDAAQIAVGFTRFSRGITYRTDDELDGWLLDLEWWLAQAEAFAEQNYWPMNDTACGMYGGCRFRDICSKSPLVRERFLEGSFTKAPEEERWNPLRSR